MVSKETVLVAVAPLASWSVIVAEYSRLLLRLALTVSPVLGPVMVSPWVGVRLAALATPVSVLALMATVTLVTPAVELARNVNVGEYWNWREPSGDTLLIVG